MFYKLNFAYSARLWHAHYKIVLVILQKEFIKLNVNMKIIIKSVQ